MPRERRPSASPDANLNPISTKDSADKASHSPGCEAAKTASPWSLSCLIANDGTMIKQSAANIRVRSRGLTAVLDECV